MKWKDEKEQSLAALQDECDRIQEVKQRQEVSLQNDLAKQLASAESRIDGLLKQIVCLELCLENEKRIKHDVAEKQVLFYVLNVCLCYNVLFYC